MLSNVFPLFFDGFVLDLPIGLYICTLFDLLILWKPLDFIFFGLIHLFTGLPACSLFCKLHLDATYCICSVSAFGPKSFVPVSELDKT